MLLFTFFQMPLCMWVASMRRCQSPCYGSSSCRPDLWSTHTCQKTESRDNIKVGRNRNTQT